METFLDLCRTRRSVRAFRPDAVPEDALSYIMECVRLAPSAVNFQPWHVTYITDKAVLAQLTACYDRTWFRQVPACFVITCRKGEQWVRKSDGKPQTADMYVNQWGADIVRMWISSVDYQNDMPISEGIMGHVATAYRGVRNTIMYQLGNLSDFNRARDAVPLEKLDAIDRWAVHKAAQFAEEADKAYEAYEFHKVYRLIDNFCGVTLSRIYHDILKDRLYTFAANSFERRSSQTAIDIISDTLMRVAAPVLTFTADEAFSFKYAGSELSDDSVHLQAWPELGAQYRDDAVCKKIDRLLEIRDVANERLEQLRQDKVIGKSLEASLTLTAPEGGEDAAILNEYLKILPELFIVSSVKVNEDKIETLAVEAGKAEGKRCARCWRVLTDLDENDICPRCSAAMAATE